MNKKKIAALLVAGVMTIGVVGGTLAWFSDTDSVTNVFNTGTINNGENENGNGVEIYEKFKPEEAVNLVPGDEVTKLVQVKNTTSYDSFIRVKFEKSWPTKDNNTNDLDIDKIQLNFTNNVVEYAGKTTDGKDYYTLVKDKNIKVLENELKGKWIKHDGYYYYVGRVPGQRFTNTLLESVTLSIDAGNEYRDKNFNVEVIAESIQADNDAYLHLELIGESEEGKKDNDQRILDLLQTYSNKSNTNLDAGFDKAENVTATTTTIREHQE